MLKQDQVVLQREKVHQELLARLRQRNVDTNHLSQDAGSSAQLTLDSKLRGMKSLREKVQETEESRRTDGLLKTEIAYHRKQAQENWIRSRIVECTLAAEREEAAKLQQRMIEVSTQLAEMKRLVSMSSLEEEKIKTMESVQASLHTEKRHLENLNNIIQEKFQIMNELCQEKDNALQQKLAQEEVEQCVSEITAAGPKQWVQTFKRKIQDIAEKKREGSECCLRSVLSWAHSLQLPSAALSSMLQENIAEAAVKDRDLYMRKVCDEESQSQELEGKIHALKEQREALKKEIYIMGIRNRSGEAKLHNMREQWQQKDQAFQQKAAQLDFERREKQLKVKEVLRFHKQKVETIEKEHVETELSYKTEIDNLKKEIQEMKACVSTKDRKHLHKQFSSWLDSSSLSRGNRSFPLHRRPGVPAVPGPSRGAFPPRSEASPILSAVATFRQVAALRYPPQEIKENP
ncbi:hypothetical protein AAFF_G00363030 [Aldrovandia affinis]|uniref:Uncharacterized protein n=1 Tax=Aldrovandia affinis TaxID=143900 RepID=A0AAD7VZR5_9TELE|nr:hypothetical protein AAFF_G00363030 [Aldrovandia affinis]